MSDAQHAPGAVKRLVWRLWRWFLPPSWEDDVTLEKWKIYAGLWAAFTTGGAVFGLTMIP